MTINLEELKRLKYLRELVEEGSEILTSLENPDLVSAISWAIETIEQLQADKARLERENEELRSVWEDPAKLHVTLLSRGYDRMNALHLAGATDYDEIKRELEEANSDIQKEAAIRFAVEKLIATEQFEARVEKLQILIERGHKFDWPYTDAFDDGGVAYHEARRRFDAARKKQG